MEEAVVVVTTTPLMVAVLVDLVEVDMVVIVIQAQTLE
jgi:hypothetical protein|tara:strand:- start:33 stop:146 length:114 start_codon:yes stop_codon:yes gene_type:complete